jgi:hypothetical protein
VRVGGYVTGFALAAYGTLQVLGRRAGSTRDERRRVLPGDDVVPHPQMITNHSITIDAPPDAVWPWLTQMGWHLGGYYPPRWVDRLFFHANWPSLDHLDPDLVRDLVVGDTIPDGPPGTAVYVVDEADPPGHLVLHSTTHVPWSWREKFGATIDWTWSFQLTGWPGARTRLQSRVRGRMQPWWLAASYRAAIIPADFVMAMGMLRGLKKRAGTRPATPPRANGGFS